MTFRFRNNIRVKGKVTLGTNPRNYVDATPEQDGVQIVSDGTVAAVFDSGNVITGQPASLESQSLVVAAEANASKIGFMNGLDIDSVGIAGLLVDMGFPNEDYRILIGQEYDEDSVFYGQTTQLYDPDDVSGTVADTNIFSDIGWVFKKNIVNANLQDALPSNPILYENQIFLYFAFDSVMPGRQNVLSTLQVCAGTVSLCHAHNNVTLDTDNAVDITGAGFGAQCVDLIKSVPVQLYGLNIDQTQPTNQRANFKIDEVPVTEPPTPPTISTGIVGWSADNFLAYGTNVMGTNPLSQAMALRCVTGISVLDNEAMPPAEANRDSLCWEKLIPIMWAAIAQLAPP